MKTKLSLPQFFGIILLLALRPSPFAFSQIPEGFNYQAVALDAVSGNPVTDPVDVRIAILADDSPEDVLWEEKHTGVDPDDHGLFSIVVGGGVYESGPVLTFGAIDWSVTPKYIRTQIYYGGSWKNMGSAQLWAVPYSMVAKDVEGPVQKLGIEGTTTNDEEALFEVRNKDGQIVFAVYNEGIRAYVNEIDEKGAKGGFAIGSFGTTKEGEEPQDLLFVSGDSVRVYIDNADADPIKGVKGGFAIGGFGTAKTGPQNLLTVSNDSVRIYIDNDDTDKGPKGGFAIGGFGTAKAGPQKFLTVSNDSVRIYIDNQGADKGPKGGFAIGGYGTSKTLPQKLLTVSNDSIRMYIDQDLSSKGPKGGFAIGGFDVSKGLGGNRNFLNIDVDTTGVINPSQPRLLWYPLKNAFLTGQVLIMKKDSVGVNSMATGFESRAVGDQSQAMGYKAIARGNYSTAIGKNAFAGKHNSFAFGDGVSALRVYSYAFGKGSIAQGDYAFALGNIATASGYSSYAFGENVTAGASYSYAFGKGSSTGNSYAVAMGNAASATGFSSYSFGESSQATKQYSYAFGKGAHAYGDYSFALGNTATASGNNSFAIGESVTASFPNSYAFGKGSTANNDNAIAMGLSASASGLNSFAINGTAQGTSSFSVTGVAVGDNSKSFGGTANGAYSMSSGSSHTTATGDYSLAMGYRVATNGKYAVAIGSGYDLPPYTTTYAGAEGAVALGSIARATGKNSTAIGNYAVASAENSVSVGTGSTASGTAAIALGSFLTAGSAWSTALGYNNYSWGSATGYTDLTDPLFLIGNGFSGGEKNAVTVLKNGRVGIGVGTGIPTHFLDLRGQMRITESTTNDVWIQGGSGTAAGDSRNLALRGTDEDSGDKLYVNVNGEYGSGTEIGGAVSIPGTLSVTGAMNFADPFSRTITSPRYLVVNAAGEVGGYSSSLRYKENIVDLDNYEWLFNLRPVTFNYKNSTPDDVYYGLIAEEVSEINPLLIVYDKDNRPDGLMYDRLTIPILKALQDQKKEIESLKETIDRLEALVEKLMEE